MAGIGFELRKLLQKHSYLGLLQAYGFAGVISSGPWVISIIGILILGLLAIADITPKFQITQFQTSITYLISLSLIVSGFLQHGFTRYVADQVYLKKTNEILPNFTGSILLTTLVSGCLALLVTLLFMPNQSMLYRITMTSTFVLLCNIWIATNLLSGLKAYKTIVFVFALAYGLVVGLGYLLRGFGLEGLLLGFLIGHVVLLFGMLLMIYQNYPSEKLIDFDFLKPGKMYTALIFAGFFYNLGIWIDKFIFWFHPGTGQPILGPLRASVIYDLPIFIAYLSIIPGMAIFLVRLETDFVEYYHRFYDAIREGGTLFDIQEMRNEMVLAAKHGIFEIIKIQTLAVLITFVFAPSVLNFFGISPLYLNLLYIDVVAAGLQVVYLSLLNLNFYLDRKNHALGLTISFFILNAVFTSISIYLGPFYFGYGFALSLLVIIAVAMFLLDHDFENLEYQTFMLQK